MNFFKPIIKPRTYINMLYLLLSFPLGIFYFVFIVTGLSLGLGLIITLIGIPILFGMVLLWRALGNFERYLTSAMLNVKINYKPIKLKKKLLEKVKAYLLDTYTIKSLVYLLLRFPLGIFFFVILVTLLSVSLSFMAVPILYHFAKLGIIQMTLCTPNNICFLNSYFLAFIYGILGILMLFTSLHAFNGLAHISSLLAKFMLERKK